MQGDLTIIVSSCARYRNFWPMQLRSFDKYWRSCPYRIIYITENQDPPSIGSRFFSDSMDSKVATRANFLKTGVHFGDIRDWSVNLYKTLTIVESEYILYMQEDYLLLEAVSDNKLRDVLLLMQSLDLNYVRFYSAPRPLGRVVVTTGDISLREHPRGQTWRTSLQVSVWRKSLLQEILLGVLGCTPWQFERLPISEKYKGFYCLDIPEYEQDILIYTDSYMSSHGIGFLPQVRSRIIEEKFNLDFDDALIDLDKVLKD